MLLSQFGPFPHLKLMLQASDLAQLERLHTGGVVCVWSQHLHTCADQPQSKRVNALMRQAHLLHQVAWQDPSRANFCCNNKEGKGLDSKKTHLTMGSLRSL